MILIGIGLSVTAAFPMGLFFLISAYFTPRSYDRKGAEKYLKDRLIRLSMPLYYLNSAQLTNGQVGHMVRKARDIFLRSRELTV